MNLLKSKKAVGPIGAIMLFLVFIIIWFVFLGQWLGNIGRAIVSQNGLVGLEAFFFSNLNLLVMICLLLGMLAWTYFGGGNN